MLDENVMQAVALCEETAEREVYPEQWPAMPPIPAARYTDRKLYELEMEHLWMKTWVLGAHMSELPQPGDYRLFKYLGQNVIISHGTDGEVRAFHNICTHRSAPLVLEDSGNAKRFLCPYHSWNFAIDGRLTNVPMEFNFPCIEKAKLNLMPVNMTVWRGFVFLNFAKDPIPFEEFMSPVISRLKDFPLEEMEVKRTQRFELAANWKGVVDNFNESYHLNTVHPSISRWINSRSFVVQPLKYGHAIQTTLRNSRNRYVDERPSPPGSFPMFEEVIVNMPIFPNLSGGLDLRGFVWDTFWPVDQDNMIMDIRLMGWKGNTDEPYWDSAMNDNIGFTHEDLALLPAVHAAMRSGHVKEIHVGYQEMDIYWYHEEIDRLIGAENVPAELRMKPVLAPHAQA